MPWRGIRSRNKCCFRNARRGGRSPTAELRERRRARPVLALVVRRYCFGLRSWTLGAQVTLQPWAHHQALKYTETAEWIQADELLRQLQGWSSTLWRVPNLIELTEGTHKVCTSMLMHIYKWMTKKLGTTSKRASSSNSHKWEQVSGRNQVQFLQRQFKRRWRLLERYQWQIVANKEKRSSNKLVPALLLKMLFPSLLTKRLKTVTMLHQTR